MHSYDFSQLIDPVPASNRICRRMSWHSAGVGSLAYLMYRSPLGSSSSVAGRVPQAVFAIEVSTEQKTNTTKKAPERPTVKSIGPIRSNILKVHSTRGIIIIVHLEARIRSIPRRVLISEPSANKIMPSLPLSASHVKEAGTPARRRARSGASHDGRGTLGLVVDLHFLHVLAHFGEREGEGLVAVDGVGVLRLDGFGPEVAEGVAGGGVEGFEGEPAVVAWGGES